MARKALLVGLNIYPDPAHALRGCLNDVRQVRAALREHLGFADPSCLRVLTDRGATTGAIKEGLGWLVSDAAPGDVLVFHYSGHGSQVRDRDGDERSDDLDEIICPYDLDWRHPFTDDDLHAALRGVPPGVNLTVVLDCCHSGTGLREISSLRGTATVSVPVRCLCAPEGVAPFVPPPGAPGPRSASPRRVKRFGRKAAEAGAVLIAACRDDQVAADAYIEGAYHGALSFYMVSSLAAAGFSPTYTELVRRVREQLRRHGYEQVPQIEGPLIARRNTAFAPLRATARRPGRNGVSAGAGV